MMASTAAAAASLGDSASLGTTNTPTPTISLSLSLRMAMADIDVAVRQLDSHVVQGLDSAKVTRRLQIGGPNALPAAGVVSLGVRVAQALTNPLALLLLLSAVASAVAGESGDAVSITLALFLVAAVAAVQEAQSSRALAALHCLVPHSAKVIRSGHLSAIDATWLVPGDVLSLSAGDRVPADCRLISAAGLRVDESSLTGETRPVSKDASDAQHSQQSPQSQGYLDAQRYTPSDILGYTQEYPAKGYPDSYGSTHPDSHGHMHLADCPNVVFMGTLVRSGHATAIVYATGIHTQFGSVFALVKDVQDKKTPLQDKMDELGKYLSIFSAVVILVIVVIGIIQGKPALAMFKIGISLAVAAIPEGLPIVVAVTLALGVLRLAKQNCIVKQLPSVESLGCVNIICCDKTGTLTRNCMTVTALWTRPTALLDALLPPSPASTSMQNTQNTQGEPPLVDPTDPAQACIRIGILCNNASLEGGGIGQPTEVALLDFARRWGIPDIRSQHPRTMEIPFSSATRIMHVSVNGQTFVKGSLDVVLSKCFSILPDTPLTPDLVREIQAKADAVAGSGLRVLGLACSLPTKHTQLGSVEDDTNLVFAGFVGMCDPPREGLNDVISVLRGGGVRVVMITGDSEPTAMSIATQLSIPVSRAATMSGSQLDAYPERDLDAMINDITVFYRTTPKHKMAIVSSLQRTGAVVAMTGDGVNDAPALRLADIGISMGLSGTDVSKEAADMILVNDDISTILYAIEEGKSIFHNIQNFLRFQLSTSLSALVLIATTTIGGLKNPLNAMQILWINIICDGPVAQSLGVEPVDPSVMRRPARSRSAPIITKSFLQLVLVSVAVIVTGTFSVYRSGMLDGEVTPRDTTRTFTTFVMFDVFNSLACRSRTRSIFELGIKSNKFHLYAVSASLAGQLAVIYIPFFQSIFQTESLDFSDLVYITVIASSVFWIDEARKYYLYRWSHKQLNNRLYSAV